MTFWVHLNTLLSLFDYILPQDSPLLVLIKEEALEVHQFHDDTDPDGADPEHKVGVYLFFLINCWVLI